MKKLTERQAYEAMQLFLERNWKRAEELQVSELLSDMDMTIWDDGGSGDPATLHEWRECVSEVLKQDAQAAE